MVLRQLSTDLSLGAQTAYSELFDQVLGQDIATLTALSGSFQTRTLKGREYVYFSFRDALGKNRMAYVGPNGDRVQALVARFDKPAAEQARVNLSRRAAACTALGCAPMLDKHYLIVQKLAAAGFFRAGGILIGTHAFAAFGNMLGVRWASNVKTLDVDFAHAGRNLSIALPANLKLSVHDAITSLEMGLLPIRQLDGRSGAQYRNPEDPELRVDFLAPWNGNDTIAMQDLGVTLEGLKFMEFSLESTTQGAVMSRLGACAVNLPDPARYAIHKLIVYGERPMSERIKASKDVEQASALVEWHLVAGQAYRIQSAWDDAVLRGPGWARRVTLGRAEMLRRYPGLAKAFADGT